MDGRIFFELIAILFVLNNEFSNDFIEGKHNFFNQVIELLLYWFIASADVDNDRADLNCIKFHQILFTMDFSEKLNKKKDQPIFNFFIGS